MNSTYRRAPGVTEAAFQRTLVELLRLHGWRCWHNVIAYRSAAGFPDLVCLHPRHRPGVVFIEVKADNAALTGAQETFLHDLRAAGATCFVLKPRDWELAQRIARGEAIRPEEAPPT